MEHSEKRPQKRNYLLDSRTWKQAEIHSTDYPSRILIVGGEPTDRSVLKDELDAAGYFVATAANLLQAAQVLAGSTFEIVVTNLLTPGQDGFSFLREVKKQNPTQAMIVVTDYNSIETAVEAMKIGAFDYLQKPSSTGELLLKIDKLLRYKRVSSENEELRHQIVLRRIENQITSQAEADQVDAAEAQEFAMPGASSDLLSLELSEIERVDIVSVLEDLETRLIDWAMGRAEDNLARAAEMLGLPRSTLQYKINK